MVMECTCRHCYKDEGSVKSGELVRELYGYILTPYERKEILKFDEVYYYGQNAENKMKGYHNRRNNKFRTKEGLYDFVIGDHLIYRYEVLMPMGKGAFGSVLKVYDHKLKRIIAIKNITVLIPNTEREVIILNHLKKSSANDYAVEIYDRFVFRTCNFIAFEILGNNLTNGILRHTVRGIGMNLLSTIGRSLFRCLEVLHNKCKIVHCDLKPENILLVEVGKPFIKLADFGVSCSISEIDTHPIRTTICYLAPEVILGGKITSAIDIWAAGCVLAEMSTGEVLFPGETAEDQLSVIIGVLGIPTPKFLKTCKYRTVLKYIDENNCPRYCKPQADGDQIKLVAAPSPSGDRRYLPGTLSLKSLLSTVLGTDFYLMNLIEKCLEWDPDKRISAAQALFHHFFRRRIPNAEIEVGTLPDFTSPALVLNTYKTDLEVHQKYNDTERYTTPF